MMDRDQHDARFLAQVNQRRHSPVGFCARCLAHWRVVWSLVRLFICAPLVVLRNGVCQVRSKFQRRRRAAPVAAIGSDSPLCGDLIVLRGAELNLRPE